MAGSQGTETSLPPTDSQVTVSGRGAFSDLKITVNQTKNLLNQAISVNWTGGQPTTNQGPGRFAGNYLQLMQCWGEDDGTNPANPGPPPEKCVFGAKAATSGSGLFPPFTFAYERILAQSNWPNQDPNVGFLEEETGYVWRPFHSVDGRVVNSHYNPDFAPDIQGGTSWQNGLFDVVTSNEIQAAKTGPNGRGFELFEVNTGAESTGLGCGQNVEPVAGGSKRIPRCWLVIVPRGLPSEENAGTPYGGNSANSFGVVPSPLAPIPWTNRIAIPLEFNPVETACALTGDQVRLQGSELAAPAVFSWQPRLCESPGAKPFVYGTTSEASSRTQLAQGLQGAPSFVVSSRPVDAAALDPASPVVYVPLTLSGTVVAFTIERNPKVTAPDDAQALAGSRVTQLNLTPRLIAKLLTQSYLEQLSIQGASPYAWVNDNPPSMGVDPDFLQFNPEFDQLVIAFGKNFGGFLMPAPDSDAAHQLWQYVLADPEAKKWLDGTPDTWGMKVNPVYATTAAANPTGIPFADPVPSSFPKSDPFCYQGPPGGVEHNIVPPPLCGTDWLPYTESLRNAARLVRAADDRARVVANPFALSADQIWSRDLPQTLGTRSILGITDSASAIQYGVQVARLSRAGDNGANRTFIAPDVNGLLAGVTAMRAGSEQAVLEPDPSATTPGAYPLTMLTYGAIKPLALDATARQEYASFVDYAAGAGQVSGPRIGQLPLGYAPLPGPLQTQAKNAAKAIREMTPPAPPVEEAPAAAPESSAIDLPFDPLDSFSITDAPAFEEVSTPTFTSELAASPSTQAAGGASQPGGKTPFFAAGVARYAVPALCLIALLAALGALEITKRPRPLATAPGDVSPPARGPRAPTAEEQVG